MSALILGLVLFLGVHSLRIFAEGWRTQLRARWGANAYKGAYTLVSLAGFALIVWGYGQARLAPVALWVPMGWTRHLAALLMLLSFVLVSLVHFPQKFVPGEETAYPLGEVPDRITTIRHGRA